MANEGLCLKSYGFKGLTIRGKIVSKKLETQLKKLENSVTVMESPLSELGQNIKRSSISNIFETRLELSVRTALRAVLGRLGTGVRTNQRYFIISKY